MDQRIKEVLASPYFEGALLVVFGVVMLVSPTHSITIISIITGVILCLLGVLLSLSFIMHHKQKHALVLFAGLMCAALGIEFIFRTSSMDRPMHAVLSITLIYSSILFFLQAYDLRKVRGIRWIITLVFATAAIVFAVLMLVYDEHTTAFRLVKGSSMVFEGIASLFVIKPTHITD